MGIKLTYFLGILLIGFSGLAKNHQQSEPPKVNWDKIEEQLEGDGLGGWVHGSVAGQQMFVFTWRHPKSFFVNVQIPLYSLEFEVLKAFSSLKRHDYVVLKGDLYNKEEVKRHLEVSEVVEVNPWAGLGSELEYQYKANIERDLVGRTSAMFKVHAVEAEGSVLVLEYQDRVIPVFNRKPELAKDLYRNDIIFLKYIVRNDPNRPIHFEVDHKRSDALLVVDKILEGHGEPLKLTGSLVMFPKSPQIIFNVFALRTESFGGLRRNYTVMGETAIFLEIREKLQKIWDAHPEGVEYDRNKFINKKLLVTIEGIKNVVHPGQANPQILVDDVKKVKVTIR